MCAAPLEEDIRAETRLASETLCERLNGMADRSWCRYDRGSYMSQAQLAGLLRPFGIQPKNVRIGSIRKGYMLEMFKDAFARYLPAPEDVAVKVAA